MPPNDSNNTDNADSSGTSNSSPLMDIVDSSRKSSSPSSASSSSLIHSYYLKNSSNKNNRSETVENFLTSLEYASLSNSGGSNNSATKKIHNMLLSEDGAQERKSFVIQQSLWLLLDIVHTIVLFYTPMKIYSTNNGSSDNDNDNSDGISSSLLDLFLLSLCRIVTVIGSYSYCYFRTKRSVNSPSSQYPFSLYHLDGMRKTSEEIEEDFLEESLTSFFHRFLTRISFPTETLSLVIAIWAFFKALIRLKNEIVYEISSENEERFQVLWWIVILISALISVVYIIFMESFVWKAKALCIYRMELKKQQAQEEKQHGNQEQSSPYSSSLREPLLSSSSHHLDSETATISSFTESSVTDNDIETSSLNDMESGISSEQEQNVQGFSEISGDTEYKASWRDLFSLLYEDIHLLSLAFIFLLGAATAQIYIPKFTGNILDSLVKNNSSDGNAPRVVWDIPGFLPNVFYLIIAAILCGVFSGIRGSLFTLIGGRLNARLRTLLMDSLLSQDIGFFDTTKTGDITSRLSSDTTLVGDQFTLNINVFLRNVVQAIGVLIYMFFLSWQLTLLAFVSVPLITLFSKWYGRYIKRMTKLMQKKLADGNCVSEATLSSMTTVRAFGAENSELSEFSKSMKAYLDLNEKQALCYFGYCSSITALPQIITALVLFYGGLLIQSKGNDHLTSGALVSFLLYLTSLSDAFNSIGNVFAALLQAAGAADKVFELITRKPRIMSPDDTNHDNNNNSNSSSSDNKTIRARYKPNKSITSFTNGSSPDKCSGQITFQNIDMYYPARPNRKVLDNLSLQIQPGSVVALVGASGGGKSSIISLIQHLYEPCHGKVMIDEHEIHNLSRQWLSKNVTVVSQEPTLFARSIYKNIIYGLEGTDDEPTEDEVREAARLSNASTFIENLPQAYDTYVGERGVQLSGGQKQRIAIARALVRKPRILLLDEATSALDAESEALVQEAIDRMLSRDHETNKMTCLVVAHRLSTIRNADKILVVEKGKVVEQGDHEELLKKDNGAYANLIQRQVKALTDLESSNSNSDAIQV